VLARWSSAAAGHTTPPQPGRRTVPPHPSCSRPRSLCEPTPSPAQSSSSLRGCAGGNAVPFPPLFPFQPPVCSERSRCCAATEAARREARLLAARSPALVWAAEVSRASGVGHGASDLLEGPQLPTDVPSDGAQVAEQLCALLRGPCGQGDLCDALPVASSKRTVLDCPC